jgi:MscS family membrane protein
MEINYLYALITIIIGFLAAFVAHFIVKWLKKRAENTDTRIDDIILASVGTPAVVTIITISVYIALTRYAVIPDTIGGISTTQVLNAFFIIIGAWIASVFFDTMIKTYGKWLAGKTGSDLDDRLVPLLEIVSKYLIWFVAFILILYDFKIDITPFLAGAGIVGIALAFAAQDILGNFFGGAIISVDQPFKIGDRVQIENVFGDVTNIGPRSTRIKTLDSQIVTVPNSKVTSSIVTNYAMPDSKMKVRIPVSVAYGSNIKQVKALLLDIANNSAGNTVWICSDPAPSVYFLEFAESSLNLQLIVWTKDYDKTLEVKDYINSQIDERFRAEGIEIPFRQVDVRVRDKDTGTGT